MLEAIKGKETVVEVAKRFQRESIYAKFPELLP